MLILRMLIYGGLWEPPLCFPSLCSADPERVKKEREIHEKGRHPGAFLNAEASYCSGGLI